MNEADRIAYTTVFHTFAMTQLSHAKYAIVKK